MLRFIFKDRIYICGNAKEVTEQLRELSSKYTTVIEAIKSFVRKL